MFTTTDSLRTLSALLVADDTPCKSSVLDLLLAEPLQLIVAGSPEEAEARFADTMPDVVFLVHSDTLDAFSLLERMRLRWGCRVHGVIIGGDDDRGTWKRALVLGASDYLPLPLEHHPLQETLTRIGTRIQLCTDTSRHLLSASRLMQVFDALPWGVVLIGTGERIIGTSSTADTLLKLSGRPSPRNVEELVTALFGPGSDETFMQLRAALSSGQTWQETLFLGQRALAVHLTIPSLDTGLQDTHTIGLLTLLDLNQAVPEGAASRPALAAAAFDLLNSRHLSPRELGQLTDLITDGALPVPEPFELQQLLEECRQGACQNYSSPVAISLNIADQVPGSVSGHPLLLRETLRAVLEWAGRESGNGSVAMTVSLQGRQDAAVAVRFQVSAVERRLTRSSYRRGEEYIADGFYHTGTSALRQMGGIGLATLLTARLGSSLILRNVAREGKTASFDLWLTRVAPTVPASAAAPSSLPVSTGRQEDTFLLWDTSMGNVARGDGWRILVAEDNPLEQRSLESVLTRLGHSVVIVGNGREAVEEFEQNRFDLVLLDILMPVMDGFEAVRLMREREQRLGQHTPVLALTSYTLKAVRERCSRAGMNGYLAKPVTMEKAEQVFKRFLAAPEPDAGGAALSSVPADREPVLTYEHLEYDKGLYREMIELFMVHGLPLFGDLERELEAGGPREALHHSAHRLKGMASNIGALGMRKLMGELEDVTNGTASVDCERFLRELRQARHELVEALSTIDWDAYRQPE